jgi:hypothetical protein
VVQKLTVYIWYLLRGFFNAAARREHLVPEKASKAGHRDSHAHATRDELQTVPIRLGS